MAHAKQLVVCIDNKGYAASLEKRKIYITLRDTEAEKHDLLRIVDESGEDYLYPKASFRSIALPQAVKKAILPAWPRRLRARLPRQPYLPKAAPTSCCRRHLIIRRAANGPEGTVRQAPREGHLRTGSRRLSSGNTS
jgi:hypothetical protein